MNIIPTPKALAGLGMLGVLAGCASSSGLNVKEIGSMHVAVIKAADITLGR